MRRTEPFQIGAVKLGTGRVIALHALLIDTAGEVKEIGADRVGVELQNRCALEGAARPHHIGASAPAFGGTIHDQEAIANAEALVADGKIHCVFAQRGESGARAPADEGVFEGEMIRLPCRACGCLGLAIAAREAADGG